LTSGEARILAGEYQEAINDYQRANQISPNDQRVQEGMRRAQLEQKKSTRKDYYKVLGVDRNADQKTIKKKFHKLALENHPDKHPDNKEEAEKKFREFGEAYEVLSNEETKAKYDNGEDIQMDPNAGMRHFQTFHFPGGAAGGQQFHFRWG